MEVENESGEVIVMKKWEEDVLLSVEAAGKDMVECRFKMIGVDGVMRGAIGGRKGLKDMVLPRRDLKGAKAECSRDGPRKDIEELSGSVDMQVGEEKGKEECEREVKELEDQGGREGGGVEEESVDEEEGAACEGEGLGLVVFGGLEWGGRGWRR